MIIIGTPVLVSYAKSEFEGVVVSRTVDGSRLLVRIKIPSKWSSKKYKFKPVWLPSSKCKALVDESGVDLPATLDTLFGEAVELGGVSLYYYGKDFKWAITKKKEGFGRESEIVVEGEDPIASLRECIQKVRSLA